MAELSNTLVPVLGHVLLHFLWQGTLIGLLAASALIALRKSRPQARYAVACAALLTCALAPVTTAMIQFGGEPMTAVVAADSAASGWLVAGLQAAIERVGGTAAINANLPWIVAAWALGACLLSLRIASGMLFIRRLRATPQGALQREWQTRVEAIAISFGLRRRIALRLVDALDTPASAGWWRPVVLLPTALVARMPVDLIEALLAHELAHIRRHDYLVNLMQNVVESLLFYHPVVWWLTRRIRDERELIADQLAATATGSPRQLALALSELADLQRAEPSALRLAQTAVGGRLLHRIQRLIRPENAVGGGRLGLAFVSLAAACIAVHAQAQLAPRNLAEIVRTEDAAAPNAQVLALQSAAAAEAAGDVAQEASEAAQDAAAEASEAMEDAAAAANEAMEAAAIAATEAMEAAATKAMEATEAAGAAAVEASQAAAAAAAEATEAAAAAANASAEALAAAAPEIAKAAAEAVAVAAPEIAKAAAEAVAVTAPEIAKAASAAAAVAAPEIARAAAEAQRAREQPPHVEQD